MSNLGPRHNGFGDPSSARSPADQSGTAPDDAASSGAAGWAVWPAWGDAGWTLDAPWNAFALGRGSGGWEDADAAVLLQQNGTSLAPASAPLVATPAFAESPAAPPGAGDATGPNQADAPAPSSEVTLPASDTVASDGMMVSPVSAGSGATTSSAVGGVGSTALLADELRSTYGVTGAGIKIGVISDSFNDLGGAAADEADGALPAHVTVLQDGIGGTDEGRAMLEVLHQIAPGAQLCFATGDGGEQNFANNIEALRAAGCNIILDDLSYFAEPFFQEGVISQAIDSVTASGAMYLTAAGNNASNAYQSAWRGTAGDTDFNFNAGSGAAATQQAVTVTFDPGTYVVFDLQWAQPFDTPQSNMELSVGIGGSAPTLSFGGPSYNDQAQADQFWSLSPSATGPVTVTFNVSITKLSGPDPGEIKYAVLGNGLPIAINGATTGTVYGHAEDPNAITVAAAYSGDRVLESYSSSGAGAQWLFNGNGTAIPGGEALSKVTLTGVDGIQTTVPGSLSDFFGTSAATPTVAGAAALLMQLAPGASDATIERAMASTATNLGDPASLQGAGLVNALAAGSALVPVTSSRVAQEQTIGPNKTVALSSLFSAGVQIGTISAFQIVERGGSGKPVGSITDASGHTLAAVGQPVTVPNLGGLAYHSGATRGLNEIAVRAEADGAWSSWAYVDMNNTGAQTSQVLAAGHSTAGSGSLGQAAQLAQAMAAFPVASATTQASLQAASLDPSTAATLAASPHHALAG